jgi:hypothetical protein
MRKILPLVAVAAFTLAGCGTSGEVSDKAAAGVNRPADTTSAEQAASESPATPANPKFGEIYKYDDGLTVTISAPQPYTPSDSAFIGSSAPAAFVAFDVTVVNGTQANFDPSMFSVSLQSTNVEQEEIFDSANSVGGSPSTAILPGRESVFKVAFGATDPNDLVMQVSPSFEHDSVIFTS